MAISLLAALTSVMVGTSPAGASVTIGQLATDTTTVACNGGNNPADWAQPTVTSGNTYVVPQIPPATALVITSWSHNAVSGPPQTLTMKVFRQVAFPAVYMAVGHDALRPLASGTLNTFPANVPVQPGDILGLNSDSPGNTACAFFVSGDSTKTRLGSLADGESADFITGSNFRLNISAVVSPSNTFALGEVQRNKKKGTATFSVDVPNPGQLSAHIKGTKGDGVFAKPVSASGAVKLTIRAAGKHRKVLNETGKIKLGLQFTFTPTGGDPSTQSRKLKLKKKL